MSREDARDSGVRQAVIVGRMAGADASLMKLLRVIATPDQDSALRSIDASPALVDATPLAEGATRLKAREFFLESIGHYVYAGDTALHVAAAGYRAQVVRALIDRGARVGAANRRGAQPLHYAADGSPDSPHWNPEAQTAVIRMLVSAGADPNALDRDGIAPIHRAVRTRCAAAVAALIAAGANAQLRSGRGSTPIQLASKMTGRGGSGSPSAKSQQARIQELLERLGA
jgi:hypothetical protein